jgi:F-type H+-transporting ATPase subunit epsilon
MANPDTLTDFRYEILTPHGRVGSGTTVGVVLPAVDGAIGILARRAPMVAAMGTGRMTLHGTDGRSVAYFVSGGFAQVHQGALTVLAEQCTPAEFISPQAAQAELEQARALPTETPADWCRRERAIALALSKLRLTEDATAAYSAVAAPAAKAAPKEAHDGVQQDRQP